MPKKLSAKGFQLLKLYDQMANHGYERTDGTSVHVEDVFSDFESRVLRKEIKKIFLELKIETVLDYGCGGSNWDAPNFDPDTGESAKQYYGLTKVNRYEPARNIDERKVCDAVLNFDVLEHVFISDVPFVIRDLFKNAKKLLIVNVACYKAAAVLPDGTNAHITVRDPQWWKGVFDSIAPEFPDVKVLLITSPGWRKFNGFKIFSDSLRQKQEGFVAID